MQNILFCENHIGFGRHEGEYMMTECSAPDLGKVSQTRAGTARGCEHVRFVCVSLLYN